MARTGGGNVRLYITAESSSVKKATRDAEKELSRLGRSGSAMFTGLKVSALAAGAAIGGAFAISLRTGINELIEAEKVGAQTAAAIRSTGGAAGVTRKHIEDMASSLQALTGKEDDAIQAAANLGLSFTKVRNEGEGVNAVYDRMIRATVDISARTGRELNPVMQALGRALNDPVKGMAGLSRIGVQFDKETKERIKTLIEEGRTLQAQKIILREVEERYKGAGEAAGKTLAGQMERAKRSFEDVSQQLAVELIPIITDLLRAVQRNMPTIRKVIQTVADTINGVVKFVRAIIDEDWDTAWKLASKAVKVAIDAIVVLVEGLAVRVGRAARDGGAALWREFVAGFDSALASVPGSGALRRVLGLDSSGVSVTSITGVSRRTTGSPFSPRTGRASGGFIPGAYRGVDDQVAMVASGEAVLTPTQQAMLPGGMETLRRIFRATGGVMGGDRFATGGVVGAAAQRASSNLGEPYGKPSRGESRTGPNSWDCSGYATYVAGVNVGGTTASAYTQSMSVRDHSRYPIVWGFRKSHSGGYRGGYDEHMGVRVGGVWYQTSGGRTARTGSDGDWQEIRVPRGLERLTDADAGGPGDVSVGGGGGSAPRYRTLTGNFPDILAPGVIRALRRGGGATPLTSSDRIADRARDNTLQDRVARRGGEAAAREQGITNPDKVALIGEKSVLDVRKRELEADRMDLVNDLKKLRVRIRQLLTRKRQAIRNLRNARTRQGQQRIQEGIRALNESLNQLRDEERALQWAIADKNAELALLGDDQAQLDQDIMATPNEAPADTAGSSASSSPGELTPEQQAQVRAGQVASNENSILREFISTAFGGGDIGTGGATAFGAATGGRWVPIRVDAASFAAATAASAGGQGYISASLVPSGA